MVGGALLGAAANRQVCPTISEMTFGNQSRLTLVRSSLFRMSGACIAIAGEPRAASSNIALAGS